MLVQMPDWQDEWGGLRNSAAVVGMSSGILGLVFRVAELS
jgi:hypothetical protein